MPGKVLCKTEKKYSCSTKELTEQIKIINFLLYLKNKYFVQGSDLFSEKMLHGGLEF